ncbi:hypothetical protein [Bosea thiooxidans]
MAEIERVRTTKCTAMTRGVISMVISSATRLHARSVAAAGNATLRATYDSLACWRIRRVRYAANLDKQRDRWGEAMRETSCDFLDALRRRAGSEELSDVLFQHLRNKRKGRPCARPSRPNLRIGQGRRARPAHLSRCRAPRSQHHVSKCMHSFFGN